VIILTVTITPLIYSQDTENVVFYIDESGDGGVKSIRSYTPGLDLTTHITNNIVTYRNGIYNNRNDSLLLFDNRRVFKADRGFTSFEEITSLSNSFLTIKTELDSESGVIYFTSNSQIQAMDLETETITTEVLANNNVFDLALDAAGNLFWAESDGLGDTELMYKAAESEEPDTLYVYSSSGFGTVEHLVTDAAGENLYFVVDESFNQKLFHIDTETATLTELYSGSEVFYQLLADEENERLLMLYGEDRSSIFEFDLTAVSGSPEPIYDSEDNISSLIFDREQNALIFRQINSVYEWDFSEEATQLQLAPPFFGGTLAVDQIEDWIYFISQGVTQQIMRTDFSGSEISIVKELNVLGTSYRRMKLNTSTKDLYMIDARRLYRTNLEDDQAEETLITFDFGESIQGFDLDTEGDRIFLYMEEDGIYKTDLNGDGLEVVTTEGFYYDSGIAYNPDQDEVYYSNSTRIWGMNSDGTGRDEIQEFFTGVVTDIEYNPARQQIYFIDENASGQDALRYMSVVPGDDTYEILFMTESISAFSAKLIGEDSVGTSVERVENGTERPMITQLNQNYPNPFNPSTVIGYELSEHAAVSLEVYDMTGRKVATLVNGEQAAGSYKVNFNGSDLASGMYLYRLTAGQTTQTRKLILVK
jgi:hypothetical protein